MKTDEEIEEDIRRLKKGQEPAKGSKNEVKDVPERFKQWLEDNKERSLTSYSIPYFMKDNLGKYVPREYVNAYAEKMPYATYAEYERAMKYNRTVAGFTKEQRENHRELNKILPVIQGQIMPFGMADRGRPNPNFTLPNARELGYHHNCQTCTLAFELRRRGYDVEAMGNPVILRANGSEVREVEKFISSNPAIGTWDRRFLNPDGTTPVPKKSLGIKNTIDEKRSFLETNTQEVGRYEIYCQWDAQNAHVFILERQKDKNLVWYDPQTAQIEKFKERYLRDMIHSNIWITRIDDKIINTKFAERLLKAVE